MPGYLLDTNIIIHLLKFHDSPVLNHLAQISPGRTFVCSVVKAELGYGAAKSNQPEKSRSVQAAFLKQFVSYSFDDEAAKQYAEIRADLERQGKPIGGNDLMIASIARAHQLTLVTANTREFERVRNLRLENWLTSE
ncbi:MAG: type II toxin-antitoxin system tRNA(fMet)-specific endonuclease VapC [Candidatus Sericytochromatia bacterium]